ncbi:hypothetical protein NX059_002750 [Plenodomus lindquistii]|nr:hypothetical protein NX059_002750 [Plenodomus lindquistii]
MGWNSWNKYACDINAAVFLDVGEQLVSLGLKDLGYIYVNIDDCWSDKEHRRDNVTGEILPDFKKFPQGIKHVANTLHELGLKLGIYGDAGTSTCGGYAGSLGYEDLDARTWAAWGIDYLKYDNCFVPNAWRDDYRWWPSNWLGGPPHEYQTVGGPGESTPSPAPPGYDWTASMSFHRYKIMSDVLLAINRTIEYSQSAWGRAHIDQWGNITGHNWRMTPDINPVWSGRTPWAWGLMPIINHVSFFHNSNFWGHADLDMLEVGNGNLTYEENRSHFALWAALKSPLIIGTPLNGIKQEILEILSNPELIAFNQDHTFGAPAKPYKWGINPDQTWNETHPAEYWSGQSSKGTHVFALNTLDTANIKTIEFAEVPGLASSTKYTVYDSWTGIERGDFVEYYSADVAAHDTMAIRVVEHKSDKCPS